MSGGTASAPLRALGSGVTVALAPAQLLPTDTQPGLPSRLLVPPPPGVGKGGGGGGGQASWRQGTLLSRLCAAGPGTARHCCQWEVPRRPKRTPRRMRAAAPRPLTCQAREEGEAPQSSPRRHLRVRLLACGGRLRVAACCLGGAALAPVPVLQRERVCARVQGKGCRHTSPHRLAPCAFPPSPLLLRPDASHPPSPAPLSPRRQRLPAAPAQRAQAARWPNPACRRRRCRRRRG